MESQGFWSISIILQKKLTVVDKSFSVGICDTLSGLSEVPHFNQHVDETIILNKKKPFRDLNLAGNLRVDVRNL